MGWMGSAWVLAQAAGAGSPAAAAYSALKRWCGGLTLAPSRPAPDWTILWLIVAGPLALAVAAMYFQRPGPALRQLFDVVGHARLAREATARVWRAGRLVVALLTLTVLSWTAFQCVGFLNDDAERGRAELVQLKRGRGPVELIVEHAAAAAATPLRDVAGLGDNLPLLIAAAVVMFSSAGVVRPVLATSRAAGGLWGPPEASPDRAVTWRTGLGVCLILYVLYRFFSRLAGGGGLPVGNCLLLEVAVVPALMLACDGFLLAWILAELRDGEPGDDQANRIDPSRAIRLTPAACIGCLAALPARYAAVALLLASQHVPASLMATDVGRFLRWGLGPGLATFQAASLVAMAAVGAAAWSGGGADEVWLGLRRTMGREGGRLAAVSAMAALACGLLAGAAYAALLSLQPAGWVLPAADAYAHYATLPVGLWTLAAFVELAGRSLPSARLAGSESEPASDPVEEDLADAVEASSGQNPA